MRRNKRLLKSILAIIVGLVIIIVLPLITNQAVHAFLSPQGSPGLALLYRALYIVLGGYLTARFAPYTPMRHVVVLGIVVLLLYAIGTYSTIFFDFLGTPLWYTYGILIIVLPFTLLGGLLHCKSHIIIIHRYSALLLALLFISFWFIINSIIMTIGISTGLCYWEFIPDSDCIIWTLILSTAIILFTLFIVLLYRRKMQ